jgi:hypothetical protein
VQESLPREPRFGGVSRDTIFHSSHTVVATLLHSDPSPQRRNEFSVLSAHFPDDSKQGNAVNFTRLSAVPARAAESVLRRPFGLPKRISSSLNDVCKAMVVPDQQHNQLLFVDLSQDLRASDPSTRRTVRSQAQRDARRRRKERGASVSTAGMPSHLHQI